MAEDFGNGVTRTLSALARQFSAVVWQSGKPPLDSELNLMSQVEFEALRQTVRSQAHSGFFLDPTRSADDYKFNPLWANHFHFGQTVADESAPHMYAVVDGMVIPVAGVDSESLENIIRLWPPPNTDSRIDFVFLEVWRCLVAPNPSEENKPNAAEIYKWGNTQHQGVNIEDDLQDPSIGIETTERVQLQYRIRVHGHGHGHGSGTALDAYPDGFEDPNILAQGAADAPVDSPAAHHFSNMRMEMGDPSLWRAGDGDPDNGLGAIDGYVYAIPICAVFRRNGNPYKAIMPDESEPNQNGAPERTPGAAYLPNPPDGSVPLTQCTLHAEITPDIGAVDEDGTEIPAEIDVEDLLGSGLDDPYLFFIAGSDDPQSRFLVFGEGNDREFVQYTNADTSNSKLTITSRGRGGTMARRWPAGTKIKLHGVRPDGLYADQVTERDVLDLRRGINFGDWDYERLLIHNVAALARGDLRTTWKAGAAENECQGPTIHHVDYMTALDPPVGENFPDHVEIIDGPDGVRTTWSDAAVIQSNLTAILDFEPTLGGTNGDQFTSTTFDEGLNWEIEAKLRPTGFMNKQAHGEGTLGWNNGSVIFLHLGGQDGSSGVRQTFRNGKVRGVRFVSPREFWKAGYPQVDPMNGNQYPWTIRFQDESIHLPAAPGELTTVETETGQTILDSHPGPFFPWRNHKFETPFIVLGGVAWPGASAEGLVSSLVFRNPADDGSERQFYQVDLGIDFDDAGLFHSLDDEGAIENDPHKVGQPLLRGEHTLYGLLTADGQDSTGQSSELYLVLWGDVSNGGSQNNGAFKIIGAGKDTGYTDYDCANSTSVAVVPLSADWDWSIDGPGFHWIEDNAEFKVSAEIRTQFTHVEDGSGSDNVSAACVVLNDIEGRIGQDLPWHVDNVGSSNAPVQPVQSNIILTSSVMYSPSRGGSTRVPDQIERVAVVDGGTSYLRNDINEIDVEWNGATSFPETERHYRPTHVQLWNHLPALGWNAPEAPHYGGRVVLRSEQDRECELFVDHGSKTVIWRPFQRRTMTLRTHETEADPSLIGEKTYSHGLSKDSLRDPAHIWTSNMVLGFALPPEVMPKFGRQDIPYHVRVGDNDPFMSGINHLFVDSTNETEDVFAIIGGEDNEGSTTDEQVTPILFQTDTIYGVRNQIAQTASPTIGARKVYLPEVISSDLGYGMRGIELPPNYGIARLYGVYERQEFEAHQQDDVPGGFDATGDLARINPIKNPPTNLLKTDADKQTLFIRQGGGYEYDETTCTYGGSITGNEDDHTYIIPSEAIDHTLSENWDGHSFDDFDYVVECVVFGFARGFINKNNYVLARKHSGVPQDLASLGEAEFADVEMVVPAAPNKNDAGYNAYSRTPYQGDPFMTHSGDSIDRHDYQQRYGSLSLLKTHQLSKSIKQFDEDGNLLVQRPNPRGFEVLASLDFYTTMGTGKIAGKLYPGTALDVGVVEPTSGSSIRVPTEDQATVHFRRWHVQSRAYTEGQITNPSRAQAELRFGISPEQLAALHDFQITITRLDGGRVTFTGKADWEAGPWGPNEFKVHSTGTEFQNWNNTLESIWMLISHHPELQSALDTSGRGRNRSWDGSHVLTLEALQSGAIGNQMRVEVGFGPDWVHDVDSPMAHQIISIRVPTDNTQYPKHITAANFAGGMDIPVNAGLGESQLRLTGMTERLPLGILLQDSDFICENPLGDNATAFRTSTSAIRPVQNVLPLAANGQEYTRFFGAPGELIAMSDGAINKYAPYQGFTEDTGVKKFRLHRGGGAVFNLSGDQPGGPIDWVADSMPKSLDPMMKGGALACKAILVRNFYEHAFSNAHVGKKRSDGDEIQLLIVTYGVLSNGKTLQEGITLSGEISPTGFGEGYAAADRYRIDGRPMHKARRRDLPDPHMPPLAYPGEDE